jgi:TDG/mug DNA glycosylase family protein
MDTLPDRPCRPGGILLVGINPSPVSVAAGHYYQGRLGQRLWARLRRVRLLDDAAGGWDDAFVAAGNGLTDLVKRPTARADALTPFELSAGRSALAAKVREWRPGMILFAFRPPAEALIGPGVAPGPCGAFEGIRGFLLSPPYASRDDTAANDALLLELLGGAPTSPPERHAMRARPRAPRLSASASGPTQRVTAVNLGAGRIRLPARGVSGAKAAFPDHRADVAVIIRGTRLTARYDPRDGPDRERSGVLTVGRVTLQGLVDEDDVLDVTLGEDGVLRLD